MHISHFILILGASTLIASTNAAIKIPKSGFKARPKTTLRSPKIPHKPVFPHTAPVTNTASSFKHKAKPVLHKDVISTTPSRHAGKNRKKHGIAGVGGDRDMMDGDMGMGGDGMGGAVPSWKTKIMSGCSDSMAVINCLMSKGIAGCQKGDPNCAKTMGVSGVECLQEHCLGMDPSIMNDFNQDMANRVMGGDMGGGSMDGGAAGGTIEGADGVGDTTTVAIEGDLPLSPT